MQLADFMAEAVLALHLAWIVWLVLGLPLGLGVGWPRLRILHGASMVGQLALGLSGAACPITRIEEWLRGGGFSYGGSWLAAWLDRLVYLKVPPQWVLAATAGWLAVTLISLLVWPPRATGIPLRHGLRHTLMRAPSPGDR
ncbi:MAG: DUF2784 family protein [Pseudomonadota bacterium]